MTDDPDIDDERLDEIVAEFTRLLHEGMDTEQAGEYLADKYGLSRDVIHQIVREANADRDPQPGD